MYANLFVLLHVFCHAHMNSFGDKFCFTSFGESHGAAVGGVLDGVPAGTVIDMRLVKHELLRRSGRSQEGVSQRATHEYDEVEWLSGVVGQNGQLVALGTPIAFIIRNADARPKDYEWMRLNFRPGHADFAYQAKYGIRDWRGGGRASARETASRVVAGTVAKQLLEEKGVHIHAELVQVGSEQDKSRFEALLRQVKQDGDTIGGIVACTVTGLPAGLGEPLFDKLQAHLAYAMMSINGCKGFDYGTGFDGVGLLGSGLWKAGVVPSPASGGIEGGISNGLPLVFRCVFKPAATMARLYRGRHDVCIAVRAVPVVEAMTALTLHNFF